jgi:iron-sulfur cluster repair protein YtfE (RIC family)
VPRRHPSLVPLSREHHDALALAFRLHHPSPPGPATAVTPPSTPLSRAHELAAFFASDLEPHFRAEEDALFPAVAAHVVAGDAIDVLVRALRDDHDRLRALRDEVVRLAAGAPAAGDGPPQLAASLTAFADLLEGHVRREERELFAAFPDVVPEPEATRVGEAMAAMRDAAAASCALPPRSGT